jgi:hypothetical protein
VEDHCHGITSTDREVLRGYQTGGYSSSGNPVGWRLFEVEKISGFRQSGQTFARARPGYAPHDEGWPRCTVTYRRSSLFVVLSAPKELGQTYLFLKRAIVGSSVQ